MAIVKIMTYRDLKDENLHGYKLEGVPTPDGILLKEQVIPGAFGFLPIYIRHVRFLWGAGVALVISQTNYELTELNRLEIVKGARAFLMSSSHKE